MNKLFFFLLPLFFLLISRTNGQELNCNVEINTQQIQGFDQQVIRELKTAITGFLNNRKWTNYKFKQEEKINCTLLFTISKLSSSDYFTGNFHWVLERPVFQSSYRTPLLNMVDKSIQFKYNPGQRLDFVSNTFTNNLTSLLAFYAYMMIGMDFDSFARNGGTSFYQQAMNIVQSAQNSPEPGWKAFESQKNRYHFAEGLLNKAYEPLRMFLYRYDRLGLDKMYENTNDGRKEILSSLPYLLQVYNKRPGLYDLQLIIEAKRNEIIQIFSQAPINEKNQMIRIMSAVDPANSEKYKSVLK